MMAGGEGDWPVLLPDFAARLDEAARLARTLRAEEPRLALSIDPSRLGEVDYRVALLERAKRWRDGSDRPTIYVFDYDAEVPQEVVSDLRNDADESLRGIGEGRAFPRCNARGSCACLYVGHSYKVETRLRDHMGFGSPGTSSLHLFHWHGHPHAEISFTAYRLSTTDRLLSRLLEEYLWDELKPLLGKRGGK